MRAAWRYGHQSTLKWTDEIDEMLMAMAPHFSFKLAYKISMMMGCKVWPSSLKYRYRAIIREAEEALANAQRQIAALERVKQQRLTPPPIEAEAATVRLTRDEIDSLQRVRVRAADGPLLEHRGAA